MTIQSSILSQIHYFKYINFISDLEILKYSKEDVLYILKNNLLEKGIKDLDLDKLPTLIAKIKNILRILSGF